MSAEPTLAHANAAATGRRKHRPEDLRVAIFSGNYNYVKDGANKALNRLAGHLLKRGAAVRIYSPTTDTPAFEPVGDLVSVASFPIPGRSEYRVGLGLPAAVRRDVAEFAPNIIHVSAPDLIGQAAARLARRMGTGLVASLHTRFETYLEFYHLGFLRGALEKYLANFYGRMDMVFAPNEPMADEVAEHSPHVKLRMWSRGYDQPVFNPRLRDQAWRAAHGFAPDQTVLLFFGRLVREKGTEVFVEVVDELKRRGRAIGVLLVGDGPERGAMVEALGSEAVFTGHVDGAELGRAVASADILINPSVTEAFCNVNLEALGAGLAIVSADVPVARVIVQPERTGLVVPARSVAAYADAVERLIDEPQLSARLRADGQSLASTFDWDSILDGVIDGYLELLET